MSDSVWHHGKQPTRLLCLRDSLGKNTGVGCHFLLQRKMWYDKDMIRMSVNNFDYYFQVALVVKNVPANAGYVSSIPGWWRCPRWGHGNPLQYYCQENPMDRGDWWGTVHWVAKSRTQLKGLKHAHTKASLNNLICYTHWCFLTLLEIKISSVPGESPTEAGMYVCVRPCY